ncbi:MAG: hypothetical protein U0Q21_10285 [Dermatophilaceae bacterium]
MKQRTEAVGATRARVLAAIRAASGPVDIDALAVELVVHPNTIRFHTAALEEAGLIQRDERASGQRGRPRAVFQPTAAGTRAGERNYRLLAAVLVDHIRDTAADPVPVAIDAGRAYARRSALSGPARRGRRSGPRVVLDLLSDMGFDPEPRPASRPREVVLRNCPFREEVDADQDVVCAVHLGILQGVTDPDQASAQPRVVLEPLITPSRCLVRLTPPAPAS